MNILWFLDKEFDSSLSTSGRVATLKYLEKNNNFIIVANYKKEKKFFNGVKGEFIYTKRINLPLIRTMLIYFQHLKLLDKINLGKIDVVFLNSINIFLMKKLNKLRNSFNLKLIFDVRSLPVSSSYLKKKIREWFLKKSLKFAADNFDGITYITDEMKHYCEKEYNLSNHRAAVWSSGVDTELFRPFDKPDSNDKFRLMYHGVVNKKRGIKNVIKALDKLRKYDIEFFLLGSGKEILKLENLVRKLKLEKKVIFQKPVPYKEVAKYINTADIGILPLPEWPGWNTSSPIKLFEYLACGKPIVVTSIPAHKQVLNKERFVYWIPSSNPERIAETILEDYMNKVNFQELGEEASNFVLRNFTWEKQLSSFEKFLRDI